MPIPDLLEHAAASARPVRPGGPGRSRLAEAVSSRSRPRSTSTSTGRRGRVLQGPAGASTSLAVVGHIDEIGVHVTHIDDEGFLRFGQVGGWDPVQLVGQRVVLATRDGEVRGVIGRKAIHQLDEDERKRAPELKNLHIDIGAASGDEARERVRIGDTGVIDVPPLELPNEPRRLALAGQPRRLLRGRARGAAGGGERRRLR